MQSHSPNPDLVAKIAELEEKWKRSLADYANLEKRVESQKQFFASLISAGIITKFIDVLDDLALAQNHLHDPGLQLAIDKFISILKSEGLVEIDCTRPFDPAAMECVETAPGAKDKILEVKKKGYLLNGQCLRPAQVVVGKGDTDLKSPPPSDPVLN